MKITTRFNKEEETVHEWIKSFFGYNHLFGEDSQTIKQAEIVAFNVLRNTFGDNIKDIFKRKSKEELIELRAIQKEKQRKSRTLNRLN